MRFFLPFVLAACACAGKDRPASGPATAGSEDGARAGWTSERLVYRKAVGGLGAGYLYQTHMMIGAIADLFQQGSIGPDELTALMETTIGMQDNVLEVLSEVQGAGLEPNDRATVHGMLRINRLLSEQAHALKELARDRTGDNAGEYVVKRKATWVELRALLNIRDHDLVRGDGSRSKVLPP